MAYYERKHPSITENELIATDEQKQTIQSIRNKLKELDGDKYDDVIDQVFFRFGRKHWWNVDNAVAAFQKYMKWRAEKNLETVLDKPYPKSDIINKCVPYRYSGYDKVGRPIYIEKTGQLAVAAVTDSRVVTTEEFLESHIWGMEYMASLAFKLSKETGRRVDTITSILDMNGLSLSHRNAIYILKAAMDLDSAYYPERLGKIFVINVPYFAPTLYHLVQVFLDDYTKSTIEILSTDFKTVLPSFIDPSNLPQEYGGSASNIDITDTASLIAAADKLDEGMDKQYVSYDFEKVLECEGPSTFSWFFRSEGDYDIDFSVTAVLATGKRNIVPVSRVVTSKGTWTSDQKCKLVLRWDNNFSYLYGKNLIYYADVNPTDKQLKIADQQESVSIAEEQERAKSQNSNSK